MGAGLDETQERFDPCTFEPREILFRNLMRQGVVKQWEAEHCAEAAFYGSVGRSSTDGVWHHTLVQEAASEEELVLTAMVDLEKGYEKVRHKLMVDRVLERKFPVRILRVVVATYRAARGLLSTATSQAKLG